MHKNTEIQYEKGYVMILRIGYLQPIFRYPSIVHAIERISKCFIHYNRTINGQLQISQCLPNSRYNSLHPIDLLLQKDIHGCVSPHFLDPRTYLEQIRGDK